MFFYIHNNLHIPCLVDICISHFGQGLSRLYIQVYLQTCVSTWNANAYEVLIDSDKHFAVDTHICSSYGTTYVFLLWQTHLFVFFSFILVTVKIVHQCVSSVNANSYEVLKRQSQLFNSLQRLTFCFCKLQPPSLYLPRMTFTSGKVTWVI